MPRSANRWQQGDKNLWLSEAHHTRPAQTNERPVAVRILQHTISSCLNLCRGQLLLMLGIFTRLVSISAPFPIASSCTDYLVSARHNPYGGWRSLGCSHMHIHVYKVLYRVTRTNTLYRHLFRLLIEKSRVSLLFLCYSITFMLTKCYRSKHAVNSCRQGRAADTASYQLTFSVSELQQPRCSIVSRMTSCSHPPNGALTPPEAAIVYYQSAA